MFFIRLIYKLGKKNVPYWAKYSFCFALWKVIRKYLNVVIIPNIPVNFLRIILYRLVGYKIGKNVFIGMKCYLDDMDPGLMVIEDKVVISYGCYFAVHGVGQEHMEIRIKKNAYIGMRSNILSGKNGIVIGESSVIGAGTLVNKNVPDRAVAVGVPCKIKK